MARLSYGLQGVGFGLQGLRRLMVLGSEPRLTKQSNRKKKSLQEPQVGSRV